MRSLRRRSLVLVVGLVVGLVVALMVPFGSLQAATYRNVVAQVPAVPGPASVVRIWMNSDTAYGETAGLQYNVGSNYVVVLGTYDNTSYPGANWYADIPAQPVGTFVRYQLFTRNQSNQDYGWTGFNWSYTVDGQPCAGATTGDNNVFWAGLFHDSFSTTFRSPIGPVTTGQGTVTLKFRTCKDDVQSARIRVWNDRTNTETISALAFDSHGTVSGIGDVTYWKIDLAIPAQATILYYVFSATDGAATAYYRDDDPKFYGGGYGVAEGSQAVAYDNSYQLTVYDPGFSVPSWMQRGVAYQVFPDRFRDGYPGNNPAAGRFFYGANSAIVRSNANPANWNTTVCDPRGTATPTCADHYSDNFYGGDLAGIIQKVNDGYFDNLGVSVLYLNPIFRSPSNHKYDTADYMAIDPDFGTLAEFQALAAAAQAHGMKLILDGVFNHTSSDSKYFDRYNRYDAGGNANSGNDGSGACEATASAFRNWYYFSDAFTISNPGKDGSSYALCAPVNTNTNQTQYEAWYGYSSLPKLQANSTAVRGLIWNNGLSSVGPYWTQQGAAGWRFDVGGDVDPGLTNDPTNDYWEGFRAAVRDAGVTGKNDTLLLGEEWGDASAWLLGNEWDSVMNYRFRSALLSWLFTGCSGNGCTNPGTSSAYFEDNDSNTGSSSGAISYIPPSRFNARLRSIAEDYPPMALKAMMNLEGSHDTNRVRFLLKKINNDSDYSAVQRMKEWWLFAFTYPGAPTLYYGDEIGLNHDGVWSSGKYEDDPYNRAPFPWPDASGSSYTADTGLQAFARRMASIHWSYRALQDGDVQHGLVIDDANQLYGYARTNGSQTALIALNRSSAAQDVTFTGLNAAPYNLADGTQLVNALTGDLATVYTVSGGSVTVNVTPTWGAVLLEKSKIETPAAVSDLNGSFVNPNATLTWTTVMADTAGGRELITAYQVHRSADPNFTPSGATLAAMVTPSDPAFRYGSTNRQFSYTEAIALAAPEAAGPNQPAALYYYKVCPVNAPGVVGACTPAIGPLAITLASFMATTQPDSIAVTWETVSEIGNAGFNLYRDTSPAGPGVKLNASLIPSQGPNSPSGFSYIYTDAAGLVPGTTYFYWLEDVNLAGAATRHEPVSVKFGSPTAVSLAGFGGAARALPAALPLAAAGLAALVGAAVVVHRRRM